MPIPVSVEDWAVKAFPPFAGVVVAVLGGRGLFGWFSAKAKAEPEKIGQHVKMMEVAFEKMELELDRMDTRDEQRLVEIAALRAEIAKAAEERHKLRNALQAARAYSNQLALYAVALRDALTAAGLVPISAKPYGPEIEALMAGDVPVYRPGEPAT